MRKNKQREQLIKASLAKYSKGKLKKQLKQLLDLMDEVRYPNREPKGYLEKLEERVNLLETELLRRQ